MPQLTNSLPHCEHPKTRPKTEFLYKKYYILTPWHKITPLLYILLQWDLAFTGFRVYTFMCTLPPSICGFSSFLRLSSLLLMALYSHRCSCFDGLSTQQIISVYGLSIFQFYTFALSVSFPHLALYGSCTSSLFFCIFVCASLSILITFLDPFAQFYSRQSHWFWYYSCCEWPCASGCAWWWLQVSG